MALPQTHAGQSRLNPESCDGCCGLPGKYGKKPLKHLVIVPKIIDQSTIHRRPF
jgi:hypothetical protein